jgi:anhydro-N-acetylmuramic acid kinase
VDIFISLIMNQNVQKLYEIAQKESRKILGLMSGTSMDGLDIALCTIIGSGKATQLAVDAFTSVPFDIDTKAKIQSVFSKQEVSLQQLTLMNAWLANKYAELVQKTLSDWGRVPNDIDLIASHGQTVFHAPKSLHKQTDFDNATLQIADGDCIAVKTGIITVSDFRQKHIAAGGEGAPLVVYGDYLLYSSANENRILLNIGGIANFTYLPLGADVSQVISTDTGPGNTLMDAYIRLHFSDVPFDIEGKIASAGQVHTALAKQLESDAFFETGFPKTIGPELFNLAFVEAAKEQIGLTVISHEDMMATLNYFTAITIVHAIKSLVPKVSNVAMYVSGGGLHNPVLMQHLQELLPDITLQDTNSLGVAPDAKEAVLFALLANETVAGKAMHLTNQTKLPVSFGKISFPV